MRRKWTLGVIILIGATLLFTQIVSAYGTPPTVRVEKPNRPMTLKVGQTYRIFVFVSHTSRIDRIELYFSKDNGLSWELIEVIDTSRHGFGEGTTRYIYNEHFDWQVPDKESTECLIRADAFDIRGSRGIDISDFTFTIEREPDTTPPTVRVIWPNGGEVLETRTAYTIRWEANDPLNAWETSDSPDRIKINILYANDEEMGWGYVKRNLPNTGSFRWFIPYRPDRSYPIRGWKIKITASDNYGNGSSDTSDGTFTVVSGDVTPPTVRVRYPNTGLEVWRIGEVRNILWTATDDVGVTKVDILYRYYSGSFFSSWKYIARGISNTGSYSWRIPDDIKLYFRDADGELYALCEIKVKAYDAKNQIGMDSNDNDLIIKERGHTTPIQIRVIEPNGGELWRIGDRVKIRWIATGLWREVGIYLSRDGGRTWGIIGKRRSGNSFSWRVSGPPSSNCLIEIVVYDMNGKIADRDASNRAFGITKIRPIKTHLPHIPKMPKQRVPIKVEEFK